MAVGQEGVSGLLEKIGSEFDTGTVFGEARMLEDAAVIPVARISYGGGGGGGQGPAGGEGQMTAGQATGEGSGMGFGIKAQPLGVVEVRREQLRWVPVIDWSRLLLTWSAILGVALVARAMRRPWR